MLYVLGHISLHPSLPKSLFTPLSHCNFCYSYPISESKPSSTVSKLQTSFDYEKQADRVNQTRQFCKIFRGFNGLKVLGKTTVPSRSFFGRSIAFPAF